MRMIGNKVLVESIKKEVKHDGLISSLSEPKYFEGRVLSVGEEVKYIKIGDIVAFTTGMELGNNFYKLNEDEIIGVLK